MVSGLKQFAYKGFGFIRVRAYKSFGRMRACLGLRRV